MLRRFIGRGPTRLLFNNFFGSIITRNFKNDSGQPFLPGVPGGGLEKLQGGIKEEKYFNLQDRELITKIREQGSRLKCEHCLENWAEFQKTLDTSVEPTALRETCSLNKHRNCMEEAFFLNEKNDCMKLIQGQIKDDTSLNVTHSRNDSSSSGGTKNKQIKKPVSGTSDTTPQNHPMK